MKLSTKNVLVLVVCCFSMLVVGCKKSSTSNYNVSVTVSGLVGTGLVLQLNNADNLAIYANGVSTFSGQLQNTNTYAVSILTSPGLPQQFCTLANATGTIASASVTNITVTCSPVEFAYIVNQGIQTIAPFVINQTTGALVSEGPSVSTGNSPVALALDSTGRYAYAVNNVDNTVSSYLGNPSTALWVSAGMAVSSSPLMSPDPKGIVVDPSSKFVYVANSAVNTISGFNISTTTAAITCFGIASNVCPSIPTATTGNGPTGLAAAQSNGNSYLYATNFTHDNVSQYLINATTGALTPMGTAPAGHNPTAIILSPTMKNAVGTFGPFLFVLNSTDNSISGYSISAGVLVSTGTPVNSGGSGLAAIAVSSSGFAYVVNATSGTIAAYSVSIGGALTGLGAPVATGNNPVSVSVDSKGTFAYVANEGDNSISIYPINANGTLGAATTQMVGSQPVVVMTSLN